MSDRPVFTRAVVAALLSLTAAAGSAAPAACPGDNGGLSLPPGFCATVFADNVGHARHLAVAPNGTVYVNTWSGAYYTDKTPPAGGFLVALRDTHGSGKADVVQHFGPGVKEGSAGGTGIRVYKGALYVEQNDRILRYPLTASDLVPAAKPEVVLSGLPLTGDHPMHPFIIDDAGHLYVDLGSETNACDEHNRMPKTRGHEPCTELLTHAGIWRYDANTTGQVFSAKERYATGIRNGEGMAFDAAGRLYVTQHGRDQLGQSFPDLYSAEQGRELPAEEIVHLEPGADYGWPRCYFDGTQKKLVLAPEYGGDGGRAVGVCAEKRPPAAYFPAHWGPNALVIYGGELFPPAVPGTGHPAPRADRTSSFSPWRTVGRPATTWSLPTALPAGKKRPAGRRSGRPVWPSATTAHCSSPMTPKAGSGASPTRATRRSPVRRRPPPWLWARVIRGRCSPHCLCRPARATRNSPSANGYSMARRRVALARAVMPPTARAAKSARI